MDAGLLLLSLNVGAIALLHTVLGPDHTVPLIAVAVPRRWSAWRTALITAACGVAHVLGAMALALGGASVGWRLERLQAFDSVRGAIAGWGLVTLGSVYLAWGLHQALRARARAVRKGAAEIREAGPGDGLSTAGWILLVLFVLGPCEPMIPLLLWPAATHDWSVVVLTALVFGLTTILSMIALVEFGRRGVGRVSLHRAERFGHALAGGTILLTGGAVLAFGL